MTLMLCAAPAARCLCVKLPGHVEAGDPVHACDPVKCGGSWTGVYNEPSFIVVTWPREDPSPDIALDALTVFTRALERPPEEG